MEAFLSSSYIFDLFVLFSKKTTQPIYKQSFTSANQLR